MDVQELINEARARERELNYVLGETGHRLFGRLADALEALNRENKTLTDPVEWGVRHAQGTNACRSRADAEEQYRGFVAYDHRRQHAYQGRTRLVKRVPAGPWVEVEVSS